VLSALRAQAPQLVVITGDAIDAAAHLPVLTELCRAIAAAARCPILATLGNWEHWGGVGREALAEAYARAGARLLGDESLALDAGLAVIATDDACTGYAQPEIALRKLPRAEARLFLSHAPALFDELPRDMPRFHLGLAGHTHGGQITALGTAVWVPPGSGRFTAGWYDTVKGQLYVSRGLGTSVIPARLAARPELPIFRLVQG
jgi:predicted MPP superfamily phosphohydrolase